MELTSIQDIANSITVGKTGHAILLNSTGGYLAGVEDEKINEGLLISEDTNPSLAAAGNTILGNESGITSYKSTDGSKQNVYYCTISETGWHLLITIPNKELYSNVTYMSMILFIIAAVALILSILIVTLSIGSISKGIKEVDSFSSSLAEGDFTIAPLKIKTKDELGSMGNSLNNMYSNNKEVITNISEHAKNVNASSNQLKKTAEDLSLEFNQIQQEISKINEEMMSASAATEEVNASTEEVNASVTILSSEMENSMKKVSEIKERAGEMTESSTKSYHSATTLSSEFEGKLQNSIEEAKVVENIGEMANVIASIAEEINLLSLNASIEAARAGEQGRGFAVVASEIGKLANETTSAVTQIQETIDRVQNSFRGITENANGLLYFVKDTVTPDYNKFVSVAQQYGEDAESFAEISEKIAEMSETIVLLWQKLQMRFKILQNHHRKQPELVERY